MEYKNTPPQQTIMNVFVNNVHQSSEPIKNNSSNYMNKLERT